MHNYTKKSRKSYKKSTLEQKLQIVSEVLHQGRHRQEVAQEMDVSLTSISMWIRDYQLYGKEGLTSQKHVVYVKEEEVQKESQRLKKVEKKYKEKLLEIEILKKFQAFLKESEQAKDTKPCPP